MGSKQLSRSFAPGSIGVVNVVAAEIAFSAAAARQLIETLPKGAVIIRTWIEVITAFNAGTSNLLTMGYGAIGAAEANDYVDTVTEGTPAVYQGVVTAPIAALLAATDVYVYYTPGDTAATTGKAIAYIEWVRIATS